MFGKRCFAAIGLAAGVVLGTLPPSGLAAVVFEAVETQPHHWAVSVVSDTELAGIGLGIVRPTDNPNYVLDMETGVVTFGDGAQGQIPPPGADGPHAAYEHGSETLPPGGGPDVDPGPGGWQPGDGASVFYLYFYPYPTTPPENPPPVIQPGEVLQLFRLEGDLLGLTLEGVQAKFGRPPLAVFPSGDLYTGDVQVSVHPVPEPATIVIWTVLGLLAITVGWLRTVKSP